MARSAREAEDIYSAIKKHLSQCWGAQFSKRKIRLLHWEHDGNKFEAEVSKFTSFNNEIVIAILFEPRRNLYHVCTPNHGVLRGMSILAGRVISVEDFATKGMAQSGWWMGRNSGCPFCLAMNNDLPKVGERIRFLSDYRAGQVGEVIESPSSIPMRSREFLVKVNGDLPGHQQIVNAAMDLFENLPGAPVPVWAPPISLREAEELHRIILKLCDETNWDDNRLPNLQLFYALIHHIWLRRLPIEPGEI
jgi:hypothetical protein